MSQTQTQPANLRLALKLAGEEIQLYRELVHTIVDESTTTKLDINYDPVDLLKREEVYRGKLMDAVERYRFYKDQVQTQTMVQS